MASAVQLAVSTYAAYVGGQVHYGDWLKVSRLLCFTGQKADVQEVPCVLPSDNYTRLLLLLYTS